MPPAGTLIWQSSQVTSQVPEAAQAHGLVASSSLAPQVVVAPPPLDEDDDDDDDELDELEREELPLLKLDSAVGGAAAGAGGDAGDCQSGHHR